MPLAAWSRSSLGVMALLLAVTGCATSSKSTPPVPTLPQPPAIPSAPKAPSPPATSSGGAQEKEGEKTAKGEEAGKPEATAADPAAQQAGAAGGSGGGPPAGGATTPEEQRDGLDRELQTSMAEFDGMLLRQQQLLEEKQGRDPLPERGLGTGGSAASATGDGEAEVESGQDESAAGAQDTATGTSSSARADGGTPVTAPREGETAEEHARVPPDVGDGRDDDVVARQLREAAMKEQDPAIREKLWQEYRDYKKGTGKD